MEVDARAVPVILVLAILVNKKIRLSVFSPRYRLVLYISCSVLYSTDFFLANGTVIAKSNELCTMHNQEVKEKSKKATDQLNVFFLVL